MNKIILAILLGCLFSSCAKVQYMQEGLQLKAYGDNADARDIAITEKQVKVEELIRRVRNGDDLADLGTKFDLVAKLGDPVLVKLQAEGIERWLYRDPVRYFNVPKVYFFLDQTGHVVKWTSVGVDR